MGLQFESSAVVAIGYNLMEKFAFKELVSPNERIGCNQSFQEYFIYLKLLLRRTCLLCKL